MNRSTVRPRRLAAALALSVVLTGCGADQRDVHPAGAPTTGGFPVTVASCGHEATVPAPPERAVTLNQGATEVMLALGLADRMAGTAYLDDDVAERWADEYARVPVLSATYPDTETLLSAQPDFVYGSYLTSFAGDAAGSQADLADLGVPSYVSPFGCGRDTPGASAGADGVTFDDVWGELRDVARVFGVGERAEELVAEQQQLLADPAIATAGAGLTVFWYDSGDTTPFAGVGQGGPQLLLDSVGAVNLFADVPGTWADVSWERVVAADPDVIVLPDAVWSTTEEKVQHLAADPALSALTAVREERYVVLPFTESTPGIRTADGVASLAAQLAALDR